MNNNQIDLDQFQASGKIGKGGCGSIIKVQEKQTGQIYAAKIFNKSMSKDIVREIEITSKLRHPSVIGFIGLSETDFQGENNPVLIIEYMKNGSLKDLISKKDPRLTDTNKLIILYGIASAMSFLHSKKIIHRDLKTGNILIDDEFYPKVADFGLSKFMKSDTFNNSEYKGTITYTAPEVISDLNYSEKSDVFAFAMTAYALFTGKEPYNECKTFGQVQNQIMGGINLKFNDNVPSVIQDLIERCWSFKPDKRPSFDLDEIPSFDPDKRPSFDDIVDELENNPLYLTEFINVDKYLNYIQYIKEYPKMLLSGLHIMTPDEFNSSRMSWEGSSNLNEQKELIMSDHSEKSIKNPSSMIIYYKTAADKNNNPYCMFRFAVLVYNGVGTDKDDQTAALYFKKSADKGFISSMFNYGIFLQNGIGCKTNIDESIRYYKWAADEGHQGAMFNYGLLMLEKDEKEGVSYIKKAADHGLIDAKFNYGMMLFNGEHVDINKEEACRYLEDAADNDQINALHNYGLMLYKGNGIPRNKAKGSRYLQHFRELRDKKKPK